MYEKAQEGHTWHESPFFPLIKYSEEIEVIVGTEKVFYWFAISFFTKSSLMYFSYLFINWYIP